MISFIDFVLNLRTNLASSVKKQIVLPKLVLIRDIYKKVQILGNVMVLLLYIKNVEHIGQDSSMKTTVFHIGALQQKYYRRNFEMT